MSSGPHKLELFLKRKIRSKPHFVKHLSSNAQTRKLWPNQAHVATLATKVCFVEVWPIGTIYLILVSYLQNFSSYSPSKVGPQLHCVL